MLFPTILDLPGPTYPTLADPYHGERPCCFSPDGSRIATGAEDGSLQIWDVNGAQVTDLKIKNLQPLDYASSINLKLITIFYNIFILAQQFQSTLGLKKIIKNVGGAMHFIYYINRLTATKVDSTYLGCLTSNAQRICPVAGLERMTTGSVVSALSYRATQVDSLSRSSD